MAEITIIVPAHNAAQYIKECLNSIYEQTCKSIATIVVNDGSTDCTEQIVRGFADTHSDFDIKLINASSKGAAGARNLGIRYAETRYVGFIDADDVIDKNMFQSMLAIANEYCADLVTCDFYWCFETNKKRQSLPKEVTELSMFQSGWAAPWNKLYRRSVLVEHDINFTEGLTYEDTAFYLKCIPYCKIIKHINKPYVFWRQHKTSTMGKSQDDRIPQIFPVLLDAVEYYKKNGIYQEYKSRLEYFCIKLLWGSSMYRICQVKNPAKRRQYIALTWQWLNANFPGWKKNQYLGKSARAVYIKTITPVTAEIYSHLIYFVRYWGRNRM